MSNDKPKVDLFFGVLCKVLLEALPSNFGERAAVLLVGIPSFIKAFVCLRVRQ